MYKNKEISTWHKIWDSNCLRQASLLFVLYFDYRSSYSSSLSDNPYNNIHGTTPIWWNNGAESTTSIWRVDKNQFFESVQMSEQHISKNSRIWCVLPPAWLSSTLASTFSDSGGKKTKHVRCAYRQSKHFVFIRRPFLKQATIFNIFHRQFLTEFSVHFPCLLVSHCSKEL